VKWRRDKDKIAIFNKSKRKVFNIDNPSVIKLGESANAFRKRNPYGRCIRCDATTHDTIDHIQYRDVDDEDIEPVSRFVCGGQTPPIDDKMFDSAWQMIVNGVNEAARKHPYMFAQTSQVDPSDDAQYVFEDDQKKPRLMREPWEEQWPRDRGVCCPDEIKKIAREMANDFIKHGITNRSGSSYDLCCSICYAVIRVFLDNMELHQAYSVYHFKKYVEENDLMSIIRDGQAIVIAMLTDNPICPPEGLRLRKYLSQVVNAVWNEPDANVGSKRNRTAGGKLRGRTKGTKASKLTARRRG